MSVTENICFEQKIWEISGSQMWDSKDGCKMLNEQNMVFKQVENDAPETRDKQLLRLKIRKNVY